MGAKIMELKGNKKKQNGEAYRLSSVSLVINELRRNY